MARRHGRNSRLYMGLTSAGTAEPVAYIQKWQLNFASDYPEVTALGDANKVYVAGLPDSQGQLNGFFDDSTVQTYTAAVDGVARKWYLYTDIVNDAAQYWFGTGFFDFGVAGGIGDPLTFTASFHAATGTTKIG